MKSQLIFEKKGKGINRDSNAFATEHDFYDHYGDFESKDINYLFIQFDLLGSPQPKARFFHLQKIRAERTGAIK